jgi:hypothetical protein
MARAHVCFVQVQDLPWSGSPSTRTLSADLEDGACTRMLRLPAGYEGRAPQPPPAAQVDDRGYAEWFVLDGAMSIDDIRYGRHGYGYRPGPPPALQSAEGATLLWMSGPLAHAAVSEQGAGEQGARDMQAPPAAGAGRGATAPTDAASWPPHVSIPDTFERPWQFGAEGSVTQKPLGAGIASKTLRLDPVTGERTFLYCAMPQHPPPPIMVGRFTHPVIEEIFVLDGTYVFGDVGRMGPGGYAFWREGQWHGPAGSETGYHLFIRVLGGPLSNQFSREPAPFSWHPPFRPAVPPEYAALDLREYRPGAKW